MLYVVAPTTFNNVQKSGDIALYVDMRVVDRVAHPGLGRQMDYSLESFALKDNLHCGSVGDVQFEETEICVLLEHLQARQFQSGFIVRIQIVESDNRLTAVEQRTCSMKPDESCGAGYEYLHHSSSPGVDRFDSHRTNISRRIANASSSRARESCGHPIP